MSSDTIADLLEEGRAVASPGNLTADALVRDAAIRRDRAHVRLLGRVDDVMNIVGHRLSTTEIESALACHPSVAEAAVVPRAEAVTGPAIAACVPPRSGAGGDAALAKELRNNLEHVISPITDSSKDRYLAGGPSS